MRPLFDGLVERRKTAERALLEQRHVPIEEAQASCRVCLDARPIDVARQLTLIEARLYRRIGAAELLPWARERGAATRQAPNMAAAALRSDRMAQWVSACVLWQRDANERVACVAHFLDIATECLGLNNYVTIVQIMSGLQASYVFRLRRTWKRLSETHRSRFRSLRTLMAADDNFSAYRSFLATQEPPCVVSLCWFALVYLSRRSRTCRSVLPI